MWKAAGGRLCWVLKERLLGGLSVGGWASPHQVCNLSLGFHPLCPAWLRPLSPSPYLQISVYLCLLERASAIPGGLRALSPLKGWGLEGWTCQQTPAGSPTPTALDSRVDLIPVLWEAVLAGLGGIWRRFLPNSQADCRHLCCQQNCRKCNSCC